jgi:transcriptional regulator with XRE-family HTH domain
MKDAHGNGLAPVADSQMLAKHDHVQNRRNKAKTGLSTTLGQLIQSYRQETGISMREMAKRLQVMPSMMSLFERDMGFPTHKALNKLAKLLGVPMTDLQRLDTRVRVHELRRLIEKSSELGSAFRYMLQEIQQGRTSPEAFAQAILEAGSKSSH